LLINFFAIQTTALKSTIDIPQAGSLAATAASWHDDHAGLGEGVSEIRSSSPS
jgi:hypothetical protein